MPRWIAEERSLTNILVMTKLKRKENVMATKSDLEEQIIELKAEILSLKNTEPNPDLVDFLGKIGDVLFSKDKLNATDIKKVRTIYSKTKKWFNWDFNEVYESFNKSI
jgi:hypothetical protein